MDLREVTYCGLYCGLCASRRRIPTRAAALRRDLRREGYDRLFFDIPGMADIWESFWEGLTRLADGACPGCRGDGGDPGCEIRKCARGHGLTLCVECADWSCAKHDVLCHYPMARADNARLKLIGLEKWVAEQEERAESGFAYADVRLPAD